MAIKIKATSKTAAVPAKPAPVKETAKPTTAPKREFALAVPKGGSLTVVAGPFDTVGEAQGAVTKPSMGAAIMEVHADGSMVPIYEWNGAWAEFAKAGDTAVPLAAEQPAPVAEPAAPVVNQDKLAAFHAQERELARLRVQLYKTIMEEFLTAIPPRYREMTGRDIPELHIQTAIHSMWIARFGNTMSPLEAAALGETVPE